MLSRFAPLPALVTREISVPDLDPRLDGMRIAHLSDVHVGRLTPAAHVRHAVRLVNGCEPDIVAMTGDYVGWRRREIPQMARQLAGIRGPVYLTLGNHDYFTSGAAVVRYMRRNGYEVLRNEHATIEVRGASVHVVGVDDPVTRHHDIDAAFARVPHGGARIALCHCPEQAGAISDRGATLILSGHTHAGQIHVRGITSRIMKRSGRRYWGGLYRVGDAALYVTPGIGFSGIRARFGPGTRSEVGLITLRSGPR